MKGDVRVNNFQLEKKQKRNPMAEYLMKLQLIVSNTEFKNKEEAQKYETVDMYLAGDKYCNAVNQQDAFTSYEYEPRYVYQVLLDNGIPEEKIPMYMENMVMIPNPIKRILLEHERQKTIDEYVELNPYYTTLSGIPYPGSSFLPPEEIITIPDEFFDIYENKNAISRGQAVHEMPEKYQELFMNTKYYTQLLEKYPNHKYLKYLGTKSIPIHVARKARDGDIMKIDTNSLTASHPIFGNISVSSDLIHLFTNTYNETKNYVYGALRGDFGDIYANYNSFIRFLTIYMTIGSCLNELMKQSAALIYLNQSTANDFFMLYGLPSVIMEGAPMISFLKQFRMILMDKGTNVVYRVKDLIGYEYTDIYTLVMVKQQVFEEGLPKYTTDEKGNRVPVQEIVFRRFGTTDDNTSYFKFREERTSYDWQSIASGDPRWWNTPEVEAMLNDMNYTLSNSKYIQLSTHLSMSDIYWQCVILIRGLLDNRYETEYVNLVLNLNLNGRSEISVFESVLILEILMNWHISTIRENDPFLHGDMYVPNELYNGKLACVDMLFNGLENDGTPNPLKPGLPYKVSSFNFDLPETDPLFYDAIPYMDYLDPDTFLPMLTRIFNREENNIGEVLMGDVKKVYHYLETKLFEAKTIHEFRQVSDAFNHIFLVDPQRDWYDEGVVDVDEYLCETYSISMYELSTLKSFFGEQKSPGPELIIQYNDKNYLIDLYDVLNTDVLNLDVNYFTETTEQGDPIISGHEQIFNDSGFVVEFQAEMNHYKSKGLEESNISINIQKSYQSIIKDKVVLDVGNGLNGPKTFEALLFRNDPDMYKYLISLHGNGESLLLIIRSIVKALETYVNSPLQGLEFASIEEDDYFSILKEVISYFKSYMVEFTKDEFAYIFDGLFDNGGNSNMLNLYDEISHVTLRMIPKDSLTLHDGSWALNKNKATDYGLQSLYDEMQVHRRVAYKKIKQMGYEIVFDVGDHVTKFPERLPDDEDKVEFSLYEKDDTYQVRIYLK